MSSCHFTTCAGLGRDICPPPMQRTILSKLDVARNDRRDAHLGMLKRSQGCLANARCALVTATPRGASRIGKSSHGVALRQSSLDSIDNAFAHMLERMFNSTSCVVCRDQPWGPPRLIPPHSTLGKNFHMRTRFAHALPHYLPYRQNIPWGVFV